MPQRDAEALCASATTMGCALDPGAASLLIRYVDLLARWNKVYNLTAVRDPDQMWTHHLLDSLSLVAPLERHAAGRALAIVDVGSGGGLPGLVLAVARPQWQVTCVDAVAKKAGFIQQAALALPVPNLRSVHGRIEALPPAAADVVVSRAFASLVDFTRLSRAQLAPDGVWVAMKGRPTAEERASPGSDVQLFHVEQLLVPGLGAERCLLWLRPSPPGAQSASGT